jgi:nucleoside phosphorylase
VRLILVAAEGREFGGLLKRLSNVEKLPLPVQFARICALNGTTVILAANGPGEALAATAAQAMEAFRGWSALVSYGFCGAVDESLHAGDIFVATEVMGVGSTSSPAHCPADHQEGKLLTIDRVATTPEEKAELRQGGARVVEMEAAAVARKAQEWNVPFYCIRVVTDAAGERLPLDFNRMRDSQGRFSRTRILTAACRRPSSVFPGLLRLNAACKNASNALGDFFADCRF